MVVTMYIAKPSSICPLWLIGIKIFLVIGWQTKMAVLMPPTHARPLTRTSAAGMEESVFMKPMWAMTTNSGTMSHVQKLKDKAIIAAKDSNRAIGHWLLAIGCCHLASSSPIPNGIMLPMKL